VVRIPHFETLLPKPTSINVAAMGIFEVVFVKFNAGKTLVGLNFLTEIILVDIHWEWVYELECE
jgi:hypothetical protein